MQTPLERAPDLSSMSDAHALSKVPSPGRMLHDSVALRCVFETPSAAGIVILGLTPQKTRRMDDMLMTSLYAFPSYTCFVPMAINYQRHTMKHVSSCLSVLV
jgi:hypothetical protein